MLTFILRSIRAGMCSRLNKISISSMFKKKKRNKSQSSKLFKKIPKAISGLDTINLVPPLHKYLHSNKHFFIQRESEYSLSNLFCLLDSIRNIYF